MTKRSAAVVGAGIAGLACARVLAEAGLEVRVFDKARGAGGRASTRRETGFSFDHGAQFFTARNLEFARLAARWLADGAAAPWNARFAEVRPRPPRALVVSEPAETRYVGVPGMSALARDLARGLDLRLSLRVEGATRRQGRWHLTAQDPAQTSAAIDLGGYDLLAVAVPAPQAVPLLADAPALAAVAAAARLEPCQALMAGFPVRLAAPFDAARVMGGPLSWVACDSSKPGRRSGEAWIAHASPEWSRAHLDAPPEESAPLLLAALSEVLGVEPGKPAFAQVHRWRYARAEGSLPGSCACEPSLSAGACGDWTAGARIEDAWLSGRALAARLLERS